MERLLAQRGIHDLRRAAADGVALWPAPRADGRRHRVRIPGPGDRGFRQAGRLADTTLQLDLAGRDPNEGISDVAYKRAAGSSVTSSRDSAPRPSMPSCANTSIRIRSRASTRRLSGLPLDQFARPGAPAITTTEIDEWLYGTGMPATTPAIPGGVSTASIARPRNGGRGGSRPANCRSRIGCHRNGCGFSMSSLRTSPTRDLPSFASGSSSAPTAMQRMRGAGWRLSCALPMNRLTRSRAFLLSTGRYKLVVELYRDLARTPSDSSWARRSMRRRGPAITRRSGRPSNGCYSRRIPPPESPEAAASVALRLPVPWHLVVVECQVAIRLAVVANEFVERGRRRRLELLLREFDDICPSPL